MLTHLRLRGFKSWSDTGNIRLGQITGLFGANSSGKTSLIQALLLLKQTADSSDRNLTLHLGDEGTLVNLGDYSSLIHAHDLDNTLEISLGWQLAYPMTARDQRGKRLTSTSRAIAFKARFAPDITHGQPTPIVDTMEYILGEGNRTPTNLGMRRNPRDMTYDLFHSQEVVIRQQMRNQDRPFKPIRFYGFPSQVRASYGYGDLASDCALELEYLLDDLRYLGPLRAHPRRQYAWYGEQPLDTGRAGELAVHAILAAMERTMEWNQTAMLPGFDTDSLLEHQVAHWLQKLGLVHSFRVERLVAERPYFEVKVQKAPKGPEVLLADVGFGVSQILPALVLCFYAPEGSTIILEQPEIHLHPSVQAGLADALIDAVKRRNIQVIVESHSEHLLRRLQRRVAEADVISEKDVALYFCANEGQESTIAELDLDTYGNIRNWPEGFFGDEFEEITATSKAGLRRMLRDEAK